MNIFKNLGGTIYNWFKIGGTTITSSTKAPQELTLPNNDGATLAAFKDSDDGAIYVAEGDQAVGQLPARYLASHPSAGEPISTTGLAFYGTLVSSDQVQHGEVNWMMHDNSAGDVVVDYQDYTAFTMSLKNTPQARAHLGLGGLATQNIGDLVDPGAQALTLSPGNKLDIGAFSRISFGATPNTPFVDTFIESYQAKGGISFFDLQCGDLSLSMSGLSGVSFIGDTWFANAVNVNGAFTAHSGMITNRANTTLPSGGVLNDVNPTNWALAAYNVITPNSDGQTISGLVALATGIRRTIFNGSTTMSLNLLNESIPSTATNRIICPGVAFNLPPLSGVDLIYDGSRWRVIAT